MVSDTEIRPAVPADIPALAKLWHEGWHWSHAAVVPKALTVLRTEDSFAERLSAMIGDLRVIGPTAAPVGFCAVRPGEIYQLFVGPEGRGTDIARRLIADGEARIAAAGHDTAWLSCSIGNDRAAAFYRKCGWTLRGEEEVMLDTSDGSFALVTWIFQKTVST